MTALILMHFATPLTLTRLRFCPVIIMWTADIQMKWRCDHRSCDCDLSNRKLSPKSVFGASTGFEPVASALALCVCSSHNTFFFISFTGTMNSINWPTSNLWVFIAQLVEQCSANAEATSSNPVVAPKPLFGFNLRLLKSQSQLRWSHLHFILSSAAARLKDNSYWGNLIGVGDNFAKETQERWKVLIPFKKHLQKKLGRERKVFIDYPAILNYLDENGDSKMVRDEDFRKLRRNARRRSIMVKETWIYCLPLRV